MEKQVFSVSLKKIVDKCRLEVITGEKDLEEIEIVNADVNRPGLQIAGFFDYFETTRIQVFGKVESTYFEQLDPDMKKERMDALFAKKIPALILTRAQEVFPEMITASKKYGVPILRTKETTSRFMSALINLLNVELGDRITRHGVLVEVYGEGILILGESGVGKSGNGNRISEKRSSAGSR